MAQEHSARASGQAFEQVARSINGSPGFGRLMSAFCGRIGPRPAGSRAMREATDLLAKEWTALGASAVHTEAFPVSVWRPSPCRLHIDAPATLAVECIQAIHSASTSLRAAIVDVDAGEAHDVARCGASLRGAIALIQGRECDLSEPRPSPTPRRIRLCQDAGAAAVVLIGADPERPAIHFLHPSSGVTIPVLGVSGGSGARLSALCREGEVHSELETHGEAAPGSCRNLIGEIAPKPEVGETVILSAHLDSFHLAPGAMDDLSGIVTLTELARAIAPLRDRFTRRLRLIAFSGEEMGFAGSRHYVREHVGELDRIRFQLNLDGLFDSTALGVAAFGSPGMSGYVREALRLHRPEVDVRDTFGDSSDYLPFVLKGVAAARPADWHNRFPRWFHTRGDTLEKVDIASLEANALMLARVLIQVLTDRNDLPAARRDPGQVQEWVERHNASERLFWRGFTRDDETPGDRGSGASATGRAVT